MILVARLVVVVAAVVARAEKCAVAKARDPVLLQTAVQRPKALQSLVGQRLVERLQKEPEKLQQSAAAAGVSLKPEHHALVRSLRQASTDSKGSNTLLQSKSRNTTETDPTRVDPLEIFQGFATNMTPWAGDATLYEQLGEYTAGAFQQLQQNPSGLPAWSKYTKIGLSVLGSAGRLGAVVIGLNPIVGPAIVLATTCLGALLDLFGPDPANPLEEFAEQVEEAMQELYNQVMKEVKGMMEQLWHDTVVLVNAVHAGDLRAELKVLIRELHFMPSLLSMSGEGAAQNFEKQIELMWLLMVNHDLEIVRGRLLGEHVCQDLGSLACWDWRKTCLVLDFVDVIALHAQMLLSVAALEPSWAASLENKWKASLPLTVDIMRVGQMACMTAAGSNAGGVFKNLERKFTFILHSLGNYSTFLSMEHYQAEPYGVVTKSPRYPTDWGPIFVARGLKVNAGPPVGGQPATSGVAYHRLRHWANFYQAHFGEYLFTPGVDKNDYYPWTCRDGRVEQNSCMYWKTPDGIPVPTPGCTPYQEACFEETQDASGGFERYEWPASKCPDYSYMRAEESGSQVFCVRPGMYTTNETLYDPNDLPRFESFRTTVRGGSDSWVVCPAGMFAVGFGIYPNELAWFALKCLSLLGVAAPGPSGVAAPQP